LEEARTSCKTDNRINKRIAENIKKLNDYKYASIFKWADI